MSIIYIHGVNTRNAQISPTVERLLRRYIAPVISGAPEGVPIEYAYWGDVAAKFAWEGASRPRTPIIGMGAAGISREARLAFAAAEPTVFEGAPAGPAVMPAAGGLAPAGPGAGAPAAAVRLKDLPAEELAELMAALFTASLPAGAPESALLALDEAARDPDLQAALGRAASLDAEWDLLAEAVRERLAADAQLAGMGSGWLDDFGSRLKEALGRGLSAPGYVVSRAVAEFRKPLNDLVSIFLGDVFEYLHERGTADDPGEIPDRFLACLDRAEERRGETGEPIIVVSHSMGGQVVYDTLTYFLPGSAQRRGFRIDFWCATASQVGLFEELKLFAAAKDAIRKPNQAPFPADHLGYWWNVWDHNDFISFTGASIFEGIDDENYDSGMGLVRAHGGYLERPSFYRKLAEKIGTALGDGQ